MLSPIESDKPSMLNHIVSSHSFLSPADKAPRHRSFVKHDQTSIKTSSETQRSSTPRKENGKTTNPEVDIVMSSVDQLSHSKVKEEQLDEAGPILHTRRLMKRKKKRKKLQGTKQHSWSSLSSLSSSGKSYTSNSRSNTPRSSSICSTPPAITFMKNPADVEILPEGNLDQHSKYKFKRKVSEKLKKLNKKDNSVEDLKTKDNTAKEYTEREIQTVNEPAEDAIENKFPEIIATEDTVLEDSTSPQLSVLTNKMNEKLNEQMKLQGAYKLSYLTSSSGDELDHDKQPTTPSNENDESLVDIYTHNTTSESTQMNRSISRSGNNLLHGMSGWSSDVNHQQLKNSTSSVSLHSNTSTSHSLPSNIDMKLEEEGVFIRREGCLQKLGEKLKLWKKRWFILRGKMLTYYKEQSSSDILGCITLSEIDLITEETDETGEFCICLRGNDGKEYRLRDENKKLLLDWKKDFQEVITGMTSIENSTEKQQQHPSYVDEYEVISVRSHLLNNVSTSWHSAMLVHMTKIAQEKGLDTQNYQCADCASPIGIIYGKPRLCVFTGQNYCSQCHLNEESIIPARIIHNWDFRKHKVAKRSKKFLDQVYADPVINMSESNPVIYNYVDEMTKLLQLRTNLMHVKPYLQTCKTIHPDQIFTRLKTRLHLLENIHLYSMRDLCQITDKELPTVLTKITNYGVKHVANCSLCTAKGFLCEICHTDEIIFPFQTDITVQCNECKALFHRHCKLESNKCPKCERRETRCLKSMHEKPSGKYLSESDNTDSDFVDSLA